MAKSWAERDQHRENAMRIAAGLIFAGAVSLCASSAAWSQTPAPKAAAAPQAAPAPAAAAALAPTPAPAKAACANPNAPGIPRAVERGTTGGPGFGFRHVKHVRFLPA